MSLRTARTDQHGEVIRHRLVCRGVVQAVGFRPAVHRFAVSLGLSGWVRNDMDGATIEVEGPRQAVESFRRRLSDVLPPLARLDALLISETPPLGEQEFTVHASTKGARRHALIPPDTVLCDDCRGEMEDPSDRRHRYPFTTCTNCGPRYSLTGNLPYDRERTSMTCFPLCAACQSEYTDPGNRRFHAEPICCPACGPRLWLAHAQGEALGEGSAAVAAARLALAAGHILAVKGLGGFQLACRADDAAVVSRLRAVKQRPTKPFAVMVPNLAMARALVCLQPDDERLLRSPYGPILLAPRQHAAPVAEDIAPGIDDLGVMLPTTPLHVELFRDADYPALVMTSGNVTDEPICRGNREARSRLGRIADLFLLHDRDIVHRIDDSVVRATPRGHMVVRRSRGWVPGPVALPEAAPEPVLALGGHLQNTACLAVGRSAFPSPHVGDLDTEPARDFLVEVTGDLERFMDVTARVLAADLHPDYPSTWIAERLADERGGRVLRFQHHLAHAAAVLGEHGAFPAIESRCAALILDGTGWGTDGTAWGCEWLLLDGRLRWTRLAHATPLPLVGGERAVREPWRVAVAALVAAGHADLLDSLPLAEAVPMTQLHQVAELASRGQWPLATGAGRVFEAAGALFGLAVHNGWEGEAAARFESLASRCNDAVSPWPEIVLSPDAAELPTAMLLVTAGRRLLDGEPRSRVAAGFHATFCRLAADLTAWVMPDTIRIAAIGGGCLINRLLRCGLEQEFERLGVRPLFPSVVPPGDGGLAYGQAVLATTSLVRQVVPRQEGDL
ncbi:MAG: carbamoyltransferase HypF [Candidatus Binatia bacterium]